MGLFDRFRRQRPGHNLQAVDRGPEPRMPPGMAPPPTPPPPTGYPRPSSPARDPKPIRPTDTSKRPPVALTIAGSDPSGGAGIQADLKTFAANGVYGLSVITAATAQGTAGVRSVHPLPPEVVAQQVMAVLEDTPADVIKLGMLGNADVAQVVSGFLGSIPEIPLVWDPVLKSTSGHSLLEGADHAVRGLIKRATLITPNLDEASALSKRPLATDPQSMEMTGKTLLAMGAQAVLIKGGHLQGDDAVDILIQPDQDPVIFSEKRIDTHNTHGTGCTLSSAIAAGLAKGLDMAAACGAGKAYLTKAMAAADWDLGPGYGPLNHLHALRDCHDS